MSLDRASLRRPDCPSGCAETLFLTEATPRGLLCRVVGIASALLRLGHPITVGLTADQVGATLGGDLMCLSGTDARPTRRSLCGLGCGFRESGDVVRISGRQVCALRRGGRQFHESLGKLRRASRVAPRLEKVLGGDFLVEHVDMMTAFVASQETR